MIKADSLKKLVREVVEENTLEMFESFGFKHIKSKNQFKRTVDQVEQIVRYSTPHSPLEFDENKHELSLKLSFNISISLPKLEKWITEKLNEKIFFNHYIESFKCTKEINLDRLSEADFHIPSDSGRFKHNMTSSLAGPDTDEYISINIFRGLIPKISNDLEKLQNSTTLFENRKSTNINYLRFLAFEDKTEHAKKEYLKLTNELISKISNNSESSPTDKKKNIQRLEDLINEIEKLLNLKIENPFSRKIKKINIIDKKVRLSPKLGYMEHLRFDTSMIDILSFDINDKGDAILLTSDFELVKISAEGEYQVIGCINYEKCFNAKIHSTYYKVHWLENPGVFICNNFLIEKNNKVIELKLDFDKSNYPENSISPLVTHIDFDEKKSQFHLLFSPRKIHKRHPGKTYHYVYDQSGKLDNTNQLNRNCIRINVKRREIIALGQSHSYDVIDFSGEVKTNYTTTKGNEKVQISPDGKMVVLYGYTAKSQLYSSETKKKTIWAHPTFLKGYKENFYNDINQNYGMHSCVFSPDGKYIFGGANHGKYVFWDTSNFQRKELIPSEKYFDIFNFTWITCYKDGTSITHRFEPYVASLGGENFFINRSGGLSRVSFIDGGDIYITHVGKSLLAWDANFNNIGCVKGIGNGVIHFSSSNYFAYKTDNNFSIYKRDFNFNESFDSSDFTNC